MHFLYFSKLLALRNWIWLWCQHRIWTGTAELRAKWCCYKHTIAVSNTCLYTAPYNHIIVCSIRLYHSTTIVVAMPLSSLNIVCPNISHHHHYWTSKYLITAWNGTILSFVVVFKNRKMWFSCNLCRSGGCRSSLGLYKVLLLSYS